MERMKPPNLQHFPQQMEKFLLTEEDQGVNTYQIRITNEIGINSIIWMGFFPNVFGLNHSCVRFGRLNEHTPLLPSFPKSIIQHSKLPFNPQPINLIFSLGRDQYPQPQSLTPEMPTIGIIFLPKKTKENKERVFLHVISGITPVNALKIIQEGLNDKSLN